MKKRVLILANLLDYLFLDYLLLERLLIDRTGILVMDQYSTAHGSAVTQAIVLQQLRLHGRYIGQQHTAC